MLHHSINYWAYIVWRTSLEIFKCWHDLNFWRVGGGQVVGATATLLPYDRIDYRYLGFSKSICPFHNHLFYISKGLNGHNSKRGGTQLGNVVVWCSAGMPTNFHLLVTRTKTDRRTDRRTKASEILFPCTAIKNWTLLKKFLAGTRW